tara:strand:- start:19968 stop:20639 length:672 start_codon:yes stop_codon:yes gene_type:complete
MNKYFFFIIILFISCSTEEKYSNKKLNYLALGDSYTVGEGVKYENSFPVQLVNDLKFDGIKIDSINIIAKTGWTTSKLIDSLSTYNNKKYDLVTLLIGVNNQYRDLNISDYIVEFENLLLRSISYSKNSNVFVLSIPDYGVTPFAVDMDREKISKEIDEYNRINKEISKKYNIEYFNVTDISRLAEFDSTLLTNDRLHPSKKMYKMWVNELKVKVSEVFLSGN